MRFLSDIVQYSYSPEELRKSVRVGDLWKYGLDRKTLDVEVKKVSDAFFSDGCCVKSLRTLDVRGSRVFCPDSLYGELCLRRTNQIVKSALRTPVLNRDDEVRQLLHVLAAEREGNVFRTDIKSFFESVPFGEVIAKLEADGLRNNCAIAQLKSLNAYLIETHAYTGLPRGLAISSTLADYALYDFDLAICNRPSVVYSTRYVDDICIVHFEKPADLEVFCKGAIPLSLTLNPSKTKHVQIPSNDRLEFLGYSISLKQPQEVRVAAGKIAKTKRRIARSLQLFAQDKDFALFYDRLRFLSCCIRMSKAGRRAPVYTGYRHVYRFCTETDICAQLTDC
jgi:hypothetical protein